MANYALLLGVLVALLVGLSAGKAWERYKLRGGKWIDRRKLRDSPHFLQGLSFLASHQFDHALDELSRAALIAEDSLEIQILLGNLYREKGQVGRAIQTHQQLLQRPRLSRHEQISILVALGLDYRHGGFVDRAIDAFQEVRRLEPGNLQALVNLEKLYEDQHQWKQAYDMRQALSSLAPADRQQSHQSILAFLENALGADARKRGDQAEAIRRFRAAIELDASVVPSYLNLGDVLLEEGRKPEAMATWEKLITVAPDRVYLAFDRLASAYAADGAPDRFESLCRQLVETNAKDWRSRLALARHLASRGAQHEALDLLLEAIALNPHAVPVHQASWRTLAELGFDRQLVGRYVDVSRDAVFYSDPHVCLRCHYRSTELLWQCPHCHEWNSFVEERLTPARDERETHPIQPLETP